MSERAPVLLIDMGTVRGGAEVYAERLASILRRDVRLFALCFNSEQRRRLEAEGVHAICPSLSKIRWIQRAGKYLVALAILPWLIIRKGIKVVHLNGYQCSYLAPAARFLGCRVVITPHHLPPEARTIRWYRMTARWVHCAVNVSEVVSKEHRLILPSVRSVTCLNWIAESDLRSNGEVATAKGGLLFVGRLVEAKGLAVLLNAMKELGKDLDLTVCGEGPCKEELRSLAEGLNVTFVGFAPDLSKLYASAAVMVIPSLGPEGSCLVALEAMSHGVPCIMSDLPAYREVAEDGRCAILFPPGDALALAKEISAALDEPEVLLKLARNADAMLAEKYTQSAAHRAHCDAYGVPCTSPEQEEADGRIKDISSVIPKSSKSLKRPILLLNFYKGVLKRGIPVYTENLSAVLTSGGFPCVEMSCPPWLVRMPRSIIDVVFVAYEQLIAPVAGLFFRFTIYPYNSASILSALSSRSAIVVHDFIQNSGRKSTLSGCYVVVTQFVHSLFGRDVIYISRSTERIGKSLGKFPRSATYLFPNSFYQFMELTSDTPCTRGDGVLLCSGWGNNKDLPGALRLYLESGLYRSRPLRILGLAGRREVVESFEREHPEIAGRIEVMGQVDDRVVVDAYEQAAWVWVHSLAEGYGRSIAEARICGSKVVATNIPPFREQKDDATFLYRGLAEFARAMEDCEAMDGQASRRIPREHEMLQSEIQRFMSSHG